MALSSKKTIAKNTVLLYIRTFIVMIVALWTSRIILQSLGAVDYGVYSAVGGLVSMFSVLTGSMSAAISRYITFELGTGNEVRLKQVFGASVAVQLLFIAVIVLLGETIGLWFLNSKMTIPADRMVAANWVYQCTILIFCFNLLSVPYNAELIAHEHMGTYAYVSVADNVLRLCIAYLIFVSPIDRLIFYSVLMALLSIGVRIFYQLYCTVKFSECRSVSLKVHKSVFGGLANFAGWNMLGEISSICSNQGIGVVLNLFFGPLINAAYGVASQVNGAVNAFAGNFTTALSPSITKSYAVGDSAYVKDLVLKGAKYSYFLLFIIVLPLLIETEMVMNIWLKNVPEHTVVFVRLMLVYSLITIWSQTIIRAVQATGNIKRYQIIVSTVSLMSLPIAYIVLKLGCPPYTAIVSVVAIAVLTLFVRLFIVKPLIDVSFRDFVTVVLLRCVSVSVVASVLPIVLHISIGAGIVNSILVVLVCVLCSCLSIYGLGCSSTERRAVTDRIKTIVGRIKSVRG